MAWLAFEQGVTQAERARRPAILKPKDERGRVAERDFPRRGKSCGPARKQGKTTLVKNIF